MPNCEHKAEQWRVVSYDDLRKINRERRAAGLALFRWHKDRDTLFCECGKWIGHRLPEKQKKIKRERENGSDGT